MKKLLPPILFLALVAFIVGLSMSELFAEAAMHQSGIPVWEVALSAGLGLALLVGGRLQFQRADAEIMTFNQPRNLVTNGLYRVTRNPMYLGFFLLLVGIALYLNFWAALAAPVIFFAVANWWYIPAEEKAAAATFGEPYLAYKGTVRRWI